MNEIATTQPAAEPVFAYETLAADIAEMARAAAAEIRASLDHHVEEAIKAGKRLIEVKAALPHGEFGKWLAAEFGMSTRSAQNYMNVAEILGSNAKRLRILPMRSVYRLAAPSTPPAAKEQVLRDLSEGKCLTEADVNKVVKAERQKIEDERHRKQEEAAKAKASERRTKAYRERMERERAERDAEWKRREEEERSAARNAAALIVEHFPAEQRARLRDLVARGRFRLMEELDSRLALVMMEPAAVHATVDASKTEPAEAAPSEPGAQPVLQVDRTCVFKSIRDARSIARKWGLKRGEFEVIESDTGTTGYLLARPMAQEPKADPTPEVEKPTQPVTEATPARVDAEQPAPTPVDAAPHELAQPAAPPKPRIVDPFDRTFATRREAQTAALVAGYEDFDVEEDIGLYRLVRP